MAKRVTAPVDVQDRSVQKIPFKGFFLAKLKLQCNFLTLLRNGYLSNQPPTKISLANFKQPYKFGFNHFSAVLISQPLRSA